MNLIHISVAFATGIGCGILATRSYFDKKYQAIADEEIESMRDVLDRKREERENEKATEAMVHDYHRQVDNYVSSVPPATNDIVKKVEKESQKNVGPTEEDGPFEIDTEAWLNDGFFDKLGMTYFAGDGVLVLDDIATDSTGPFAEVEDTIGIDIFEDFINSEELEIFVRNPDTGIDYDVVKDFRSYNDV